MASLYRMFCACYMLRKVKIPGAHSPHNYPRIQLAYMLTLEHWRSTGHVAFDVMDGNMYLLNEEYGEIYFSLLSRCVLGDYCKSNFEHMDAQYRLLPIYQQVKADIINDTSNSSNSITWHHNIDPNSEEVVMTSVFFKRCVTQILNGSYKSYPYAKQYGTADVCAVDRGVTSIPVVFDTTMVNDMDTVFRDVKNTICSNWMSDKRDHWPGGNLPPNDEVDDSLVQPQEDDISSDDEQKSEVVWGPGWPECVIGQFAVVRKNFTDGTRGICVYKITSKLTSDRETNIDRMKFEGMEYVCHMDNRTIGCVAKGRWRYIRQFSTIRKEMNWSAVCYFEKLNDNDYIPHAFVKQIMTEHGRRPLF